MKKEPEFGSANWFAAHAGLPPMDEEEADDE